MSFKTNLSAWFNTKHNDTNFWQVPVRIERAADNPLDASTLFKSLADATKYANGEDPVTYGDGAYTAAKPYPGQFIAVVDETTGATTGYIIGGNGNLIELGSVESTINGMNVTVGDQKIPLTVVDNKIELSVGGGLKMENGVLTVAEISTISDISANATSNDPAATSAIVEYTKNYVAEKATVTIEQQTTAETGYASTYVIKQGGVELGTKINIPKDFLVKSAELLECSEDGKPDASLKKGDKYIDFVVNTADGSETAQHIYLKVEDLVDVYTGLSSDTIDLSVVGTQISAYVRDGSIAKKHLAADVIAWGSELSDNAVAVANAYTDTTVAAVSSALSDDYVKKIGAAQEAAIAKAMEVSSAASAYTDAQIAAHNTAANELLFQVSADAVTSALTDAKAYTDEKIGAIDYAAFAMLSDLESLSDEVSAISTDLEGKIGQTLTDAKDYADQTSANALADAKAYTDELCGSISVTVNQKITDLNIGQYAISSDVSAELCAVSAETLVSAEADAAAKVAAEATARTEAIQALSDALSGDIKNLAEDYAAVKAEYAAVSADYKTVSADHEGRIDTLETGTAALSGRMNVAEGNITNLQNIVNSTDLSALATATGDAAKVASKQYVNETVASIGDVLHFIGVVAVPEGMDLTASEGYQALYPDGKTPTKGDVVLDSVSGNEYVYAENYNNGEASWVVIGDENNHATKTELKAEEDARKAADTYLSGAIDNKIYYGDYGSVVSADSLSVVKISQNEYHKLVNGENGGINDKAVYIVNNDGAYNMYDERIINVGAPVSANDAATKEYVDAAKEEAIAAIPLSVSQLVWDIEQISCGGAFSF